MNSKTLLDTILQGFHMTAAHAAQRAAVTFPKNDGPAQALHHVSQLLACMALRKQGMAQEHLAAFFKDAG